MVGGKRHPTPTPTTALTLGFTAEWIDSLRDTSWGVGGAADCAIPNYPVLIVLTGRRSIMSSVASLTMRERGGREGCAAQWKGHNCDLS